MLSLQVRCFVHVCCNLAPDTGRCCWLNRRLDIDRCTPAGNPLPHLQGLGADVAFPALHCATAPSMPALAASDASLDLSTGARCCCAEMHEVCMNAGHLQCCHEHSWHLLGPELDWKSTLQLQATCPSSPPPLSWNRQLCMFNVYRHAASCVCELSACAELVWAENSAGASRFLADWIEAMQVGTSWTCVPGCYVHIIAGLGMIRVSMMGCQNHCLQQHICVSPACPRSRWTAVNVCLIDGVTCFGASDSPAVRLSSMQQCAG